jgi:hypothetical protein
MAMASKNMAAITSRRNEMAAANQPNCGVWRRNELAAKKIRIRNG